jgi:rare lipoprotein A
MFSPASSYKCKCKSDSRAACGRRALVALTLALALLPDIVWGAQDEHIVSITDARKPDTNSDVVVLTLTNVERPAAEDTKSSLPDETGVQDARIDTCRSENTVALSLIALPPVDSELLPLFAAASRTGHHMFDLSRDLRARASSDGVDLASFAQKKLLPEFAAAYRGLLKRVAIMALPRIEGAAALARATITGKVSTYNPYRDGREEGGPETASGELYDPAAWTAAIKTDLRNRFGGVRYGKLYQPAYALVESGGKRLIVKINDVGPLRPGRVLDLNERSMRHFDPFLTRGLINDAKITLLPGEDWTPGPVGTAYALDFDGAEQPALVAQSGSIDPTPLHADTEMNRWSAPRERARFPNLGSDVLAEVRPSEGG